ncbi:putative transposon Ty5-1 protein [Nymphaea thermarum]|nr:putative transposon Ty5-1 protein [Nymphaea thermarum]
MSPKVGDWIVDSGATHHMTGDPKMFQEYKLSSGQQRVSMADGSSISVAGKGSLSLLNKYLLHNALHVPNIPVNLLSVSSITKELSYNLIFSADRCFLQDLVTGTKIEIGSVSNGLYKLLEARVIASRGCRRSHRSWRRAFFVDRSSWKLSSLNAVEVPASVFRLQPIRAVVLLLGELPWDPCCCLGIRAATKSVPPPWDPCCLGFRTIASGSMCAVISGSVHAVASGSKSPRDPCMLSPRDPCAPSPRVCVVALVLLPSPSPVSLVPLSCFPEKKEDMRA